MDFSLETLWDEPGQNKIEISVRFAVFVLVLLLAGHGGEREREMFCYLLVCWKDSSEVPLVMFSRMFPCKCSCGTCQGVCRSRIAFSVWKGKPLWIACFFLLKPTFTSSLYCLDDCVWLLLNQLYPSCSWALLHLWLITKIFNFFLQLASEGNIFRELWVNHLLITVAVRCA